MDGVSSFTNGRFDSEYSRRDNSRRDESRRDFDRFWSSRSRRSANAYIEEDSGGTMMSPPLYATSSSASSRASPWDAASAGAAAGALTSAMLVLAAEGHLTPFAQVRSCSRHLQLRLVSQEQGKSETRNQRSSTKAKQRGGWRNKLNVC